MAWTALYTNANALYQPLNQVAHGFAQGTIVIWDGAAWILADDSSEVNSADIMMVSKVLNADQFYVTQVGFVSELTVTPTEGGPFIPGTSYYLSATPGELTAIAPTAPGDAELPCYKAYDATSGFFSGGYGKSIPVEAANRALSNLLSVAINTALLSQTDNTINFGAQNNRWGSVYATNFETGHTATNSFTLSAWDNILTTSTPFITLTAGNTPTCALASGVSAVTQSPLTGGTFVATCAYADAAAAAVALAGITAVPPNYTFAGDNTQGAEIRLRENTTNGTNFCGWRAPASIATDFRLTMPSALPSVTLSFPLFDNTGVMTFDPTPGNTTSTVTPEVFVVTCTAAIGPANTAMGKIQHPYNPPAAGYYFSPLGCEGIDVATPGLSLTNDTLYVFPFYIPAGLTSIALGINTGDATGTGDLEMAVFGCTSDVTSGLPQAGVAITNTVTFSNVGAGASGTVLTNTTGWNGGVVPAGGYVYVAIRADNIGTAITLANAISVNATLNQLFFGIGTTYTVPSSNTYGFLYSGRTSMPTTLISVTPTSIITTPVGLCLYR